MVHSLSNRSAAIYLYSLRKSIEPQKGIPTICFAVSALITVALIFRCVTARFASQSLNSPSSQPASTSSSPQVLAVLVIIEQFRDNLFENNFGLHKVKFEKLPNEQNIYAKVRQLPIKTGTKYYL
jgi:flagellar basal body-associated protein FliL